MNKNIYEHHIHENKKLINKSISDIYYYRIIGLDPEREPDKTYSYMLLKVQCVELTASPLNVLFDH